MTTEGVGLTEEERGHILAYGGDWTEISVEGMFVAVERIVDARLAASEAALARVRGINRHEIAAAIYAGGGAVNPDATDRVLRLLRAALTTATEEGQL